MTLEWKRKSQLIGQWNDKAGLVAMQDDILESHRKMMAFWTIKNKFHIPRGYECIWQSILAFPSLMFLILELVVEEPLKDWPFLWCTFMMYRFISWLNIELG